MIGKTIGYNGVHNMFRHTQVGVFFLEALEVKQRFVEAAYPAW